MLGCIETSLKMACSQTPPNSFPLPQYLTCLKTSRSLTDKLSFDVGLQEHSTGAVKALTCTPVIKLAHQRSHFQKNQKTLYFIYTWPSSVTFLKSQLSKCQGEACWWTIHPASKQRSEGEKVRIGDDLILVSVSTERYLVGRPLIVTESQRKYVCCCCCCCCCIPGWMGIVYF